MRRGLLLYGFGLIFYEIWAGSILPYYGGMFIVAAFLFTLPTVALAAIGVVAALIGAGIQRSLSPALQEEEARHHGLRLHYQLIDLDGAVRGTGRRGCTGWRSGSRRKRPVSEFGFALSSSELPCATI